MKFSKLCVSTGTGIPQGGKISAFVWNVFFAALYEAKFRARVRVTFAGYTKHFEI